MKTLETIFNQIKFGDIVLMQEKTDKKYSKPTLVCIVGVDIWDMATAVHYVDYKCFRQWQLPDEEAKSFTTKEMTVDSFGEWMSHWRILGHWNSMPDFKELLSSYRNLAEGRILIVK